MQKIHFKATEKCVSAQEFIPLKRIYIMVQTELKEGKRMFISVKHGDLQYEWNSTIATKAPQHFILNNAGILLEDVVYSLANNAWSELSGNLWQFGFIKL